jgi:hypothetical protein
MARYVVLDERGAHSGDTVRIIRDGFHAMAFILPVVWLLWNRLWLHAALMFAVMGLTAAALNTFAPQSAPALTGLVNFALGLLTALEGTAWLVADRERKGASVQSVVLARNLREAEELCAADIQVGMMPPLPVSRSFRPVSQASLIPLTGA